MGSGVFPSRAYVSVSPEDASVASEPQQARFGFVRKLGEHIAAARTMVSAVQLLERRPVCGGHEHKQLLSLRSEASRLLNALEALLGDTHDSAEVSAQPKIPERVFTAHKKPLRLLLVDDRRINQLILADEFSSRGDFVVVADSGLKALELLHEQAFDAVLADVNMPNMDGLGLAKAIRELRRPASKLPIILLVPEESPVNLEKARVSGASAIARKHAGVEHILSLLPGYRPSKEPLWGRVPAGELSSTVH